jgi:ribosomal protein L7/L12
MLSEGAEIEEVISTLRRKGVSKVESIKAVAELTGDSLLEAKQTVHSSLTWRDAYEAGERLHDALEDTVSRSHPGEE